MSLQCFQIVHPPRAWIKVDGEDAFSYLQSQTSQDLRGVEEGAVRYTLWLNRKGKISADSYILYRNDAWWCLSNGTAGEDLLEVAQANIIADDVDFQDASDGQQMITLWGKDCESTFLQHAVRTTNAKGENGWFEIDGLLGLRSRLPNCFHLIGESDTVQRVSDRFLEQGICVGSEADLRLLALDAGIGRVGAEVSTDDLPQEVGLDTAGVSFTKGCYLGQEVMARLQAMGRVQKRLCKVRLSEHLSFDGPVDLFDQDNKVGELRGVEYPLGLAMLQRRKIRGTEYGLSLQPNASPVVWLLEQP